MQLHRHKDEFISYDTNVVFIAFSAGALARNWLQETGISFSILIDQERIAYNAFQLDRSLLRSWGPKTWLAYARLMLKGHRWRGIQDDSTQLGGDFLIDRQGKILFTLRSRDPSHRPSVEKLLQLVSDHHRNRGA